MLCDIDRSTDSILSLSFSYTYDENGLRVTNTLNGTAVGTVWYLGYKVYKASKSKADPDPHGRPNQKKQGRERKEQKKMEIGSRTQIKDQILYPNTLRARVIENIRARGDFNEFMEKH